MGKLTNDDERDQIPWMTTADQITEEVWTMVEYCRTRYVNAGDSIMVLLQCAAILGVAAYQQPDGITQTNREALTKILNDAITQAERIKGVQ